MISGQALDDSEPRKLQLIRIFISLQLFGLFGVAIMLATVLFFRGPLRHPTWISFALSWIIFTVSYTLLFFAGQLAGPEPDYYLCLIQASMIYAVPPL